MLMCYSSNRVLMLVRRMWLATSPRLLSVLLTLTSVARFFCILFFVCLKDTCVLTPTPKVVSTATGLFGRTVLSLKCAHGGPLPATRISPGDTVQLSHADDSGLTTLGQGVRGHACGRAVAHTCSCPRW